MQANHATGSDAVAVERPDTLTVPAVVDWIVGALAAIFGLALVLGGAAVLAVVDRDLIAAAIAEDAVSAPSLTAAELTDVGLTTLTWTGAGLVATGALLFVAAVAYVAIRRRAHARRAAGEPASDFAANAVVGAVGTVVLGFLPFSPAFRGAIAGYFERGESERTVGVGAVSGLLAAAPVLAIATFVLGGVVAALLAVDLAGFALLAGAGLLLSLMVVATVGAGLGALGGYVGGKLATEASGRPGAILRAALESKDGT